MDDVQDWTPEVKPATVDWPEDYYDDGQNDMFLGDPDWDYPRE